MTVLSESMTRGSRATLRQDSETGASAGPGLLAHLPMCRWSTTFGDGGCIMKGWLSAGPVTA